MDQVGLQLVDQGPHLPDPRPPGGRLEHSHIEPIGADRRLVALVTVEQADDGGFDASITEVGQQHRRGSLGAPGAQAVDHEEHADHELTAFGRERIASSLPDGRRAATISTREPVSSAEVRRVFTLPPRDP